MAAIWTRKNKTGGNLVFTPATKVNIITSKRGGKGTKRTVKCLPLQGSPFPKVAETVPSDDVYPATSDMYDKSSLPSRNRSYASRKSAEVEAWENSRGDLFNAYVQQRAPHCFTCYICGSSQALFRCQDCLPQPLCQKCVKSYHRLSPLHVIEKWYSELGIFWPFDIPEIKTLVVPEIIPELFRSSKVMKLIDEKGRTHKNCTVVFDSRSLLMGLVKLGFWPLTPTSPNKAVSIRLLAVLHALTLECQTSIAGFTSALDKVNQPHFEISKLKSITRGECVPEFRLFWFTLCNGPFMHFEGMKHWITDCPACPKTRHNGDMIVSMDANFGLVHKANSGITYNKTSPLQDMYFLNQDPVDEFVEGYYQDSKDNSEECSQFQAAEAIRSKNKAPNLTVTGVFGGSCRHEIPKVFMDIRHGERLAYSVLTIQHLKQKLEDEIQLKVFYDIACVLVGHLKKRAGLDLIANVDLAIPAFHAYGHKAHCQITMNPRRMPGFGLSDGEQMERLWSYLRLFSKITKEQTPGHRKDLLTMALQHFAEKKVEGLAKNLIERLQRAVRGSYAAEQNLKLEMACIEEFPENLDEFLLTLEYEEGCHFDRRQQMAGAVPTKTWQLAYAKELLRYFTLRSQMQSGLVDVAAAEKVLQTTQEIEMSSKKLLSFEKKYKFTRWTPTCREYLCQLQAIEDSRRRNLLYKLQGLASEKQFFNGLTKSKQFPEGQAIATKIAAQVKKIARNIASNVKAYNIGGEVGQPSQFPSKVKIEEVQPGSDIFTALDVEVHTGTIPFQVRRKILDEWHRKSRCEEERQLIVKEMENTYNHFCLIHSTLSLLLKSMDCSRSFELGLCGLGGQYLALLELSLDEMYGLFKPYIDITLPPKEYEPPTENFPLHCDRTSDTDSDPDDEDHMRENDYDDDDEFQGLSHDLEIIFD